MFRSLMAAFMLVSAVTTVSLAAQQSTAPAPAATYVSAGNLTEVLKKATAGDRPTSDTNAKNIPIPPNNVAINIGHRTKAGATMMGSTHATLTEIWYVTEGSGTVTTGGTIVNPTRAANGDTRGMIENGVNQKVTVGDVIVIPPGTPHTFSDLESSLLVFLNVRVGPGQ